MICQIMRMPMNILIFMIMAGVIFALIHLITMLIHMLLIFLGHRSLTIYLMMKWKPLKLSRHFSPSWWLCQVLTVLTSVLLPIINLLKHPRLLITLLFSLKINLVYIFHILRLNHMITSLMHGQKSVHTHHLCKMCCNNMVCLQNVCLVLLLFCFLWTRSNFEQVGFYCIIFLVCWFTWISFWSTMPSPTWVNRYASGCIGNITSHE